MVHRGPSKGCQRCKSRHIRCNLQKPSCQQCTKLNFNCPGYGHRLDAVLKNQTATIIKRYQVTKDNVKQPKAQPKASIPQELYYSLEACAVTYMFTRAVRDCRASHGHLDFLKPLYLKATSGSPLSLSANWLAIVMMEICLKQQRSDADSQLQNKVIRSINEAINNPRDRIKDETLQAVLLLEFGEYLRFRRYGMKPTLAVHQSGAEALIRSRGDANFNSQYSFALFTAARHNAVGMAMQGIRGFINWDIWTTFDAHEDINYSKAPETELDKCGITFIALQYSFKQMQIYNLNAILEVRNHALALLYRLQEWQNDLPSDWLPQTSFMNFLVYPSPEVCYIFCQWYLLQLDLSHLIFQLSQQIMPVDSTTVASLPELQMNWINKIINSSLSFIESDRTESVAVSPRSLTNNLPLLSVKQCYNSPFGSQLLCQTLRRLRSSISKAMLTLSLTPTIQLKYQQILNWTVKEEETIHKAFPLADHVTVD